MEDERGCGGEPTRIIYYSQALDRSMAERLSRRMEAEEKFDVLEGLSEVYRSISLIDIESEELHLYQNITLPDAMRRLLKNAPYEEAMKGIADEILAKEDATNFLEETRLINVRKELMNKKTYHVLCHVKSEAQEDVQARYEKFSFCKAADDEGTIVMATRDITEAIEWGQKLVEQE